MASFLKWVRNNVFNLEDGTKRNNRILGKLPLEVYYTIFDEHLSLYDITNAQCSCQFFRDIGRSVLWSRLFIQHGMIPTRDLRNERLLSGLYCFVGSKDLIYLDEEELLFLPTKRSIVVRRDLDAFYMLLHYKKDEIIPLVQYLRVNIDGRRDQGDAGALDQLFIPMAQHLSVLELYVSSAFGVEGRLNKLLHSLSSHAVVKLCIHPLLPGPIDELPIHYKDGLNIVALRFIQWDQRHNSYAISSWKQDDNTLLHYIQRYVQMLPSSLRRLVIDHRAFTFSDIMGLRLRLKNMVAKDFKTYLSGATSLAELTLRNFEPFVVDDSSSSWLPDTIQNLTLLNCKIQSLDSMSVTQLCISFTNYSNFRDFFMSYNLPNVECLYCDTTSIDETPDFISNDDRLHFPKINQVYWRGSLDLLPLVAPNATSYIFCGIQANLELESFVSKLYNIQTVFVQFNFNFPRPSLRKLKKVVTNSPREITQAYICKPCRDDTIYTTQLYRYLTPVPEHLFDLPVAYKVNIPLLKDLSDSVYSEAVE
ncbi:hypothetical protein TRICI_000094 [Trichomonascus ciferrii]|uniref:F-box domain-containing protein n=1 Tax=Trichomonascus ciferrii TaxID=44093 RepID=A0A642VEI3_9ASCO|nr:hypothetical protein TRICI_000094 [Trichomonascus ciferrii]